MGKGDDNEHAADLGAPGTRRTRTETIDHASMVRALKDAFEAGGSQSRAALETMSSALKDAYAEIGRLHGSVNVATERSQGLVSKLAEVAGQNVALTLAEGQAKAATTEAHEKGETTRHAITTLATNPFLAVALETLVARLAPGAKILPPRPAGPGNTPREAAERFAASLRSGSEASKMLLDVLSTYCADEIGRPDDLGLLLEFVGSVVSDPPTPEAKPAEAPPTPEGEVA